MMLRTIIAVTLCTVGALALDKDGKAKAFSLFNVVTFKNEECKSSSTTPNSGPRNGTCYTKDECAKNGGQAAGSCALGFGTCCIFTYQTCGTDVFHNCSYVRNEGYPSSITKAATCAYNIKKADKQVCTFRLDFETFNLLAGTASVDANGDCQDKFTVTGLSTGNIIPTICGSNSGQHIYVEVGTAQSDIATLNFEFANAAANRNFEIKITQYICNSRLKPPEGCLQWHTGTEGRLETFNFAGNFQHLNDQKYSICIRQEMGFCCVRYSVCNDPFSFSLFNIDVVGMGTAQVDSDCSIDWIEIEGSMETCGRSANVNRYCGNHLAGSKLAKANFDICDCTPPFYVGIRTNAAGADADTNTDVQSRGVCLNYVQLPCGQSVWG